MPKRPRMALGGIVYHVLNRANDRKEILKTAGDFEALRRVLAEAHEKVPMRTLCYCLMPNHWHLVLWPREDGDLSAFMHWMTVTHSNRWRTAHKSVGAGHLYQGRFRSFPVASADADPHYFRVCRYVERNALRAGLVQRAEDWPWCSLHERLDTAAPAGFLCDGPEPWLSGWPAFVNEPISQAEIDSLQRCVTRGSPFGPEAWVARVAVQLGLESTLRQRGRPSKPIANLQRNHP